MNRIPRQNTRRRGWLMMMLIAASVRVFAGVPDLELDAHAADAHSAGFGLIAEHSYDVSHDGDATDAHFHCHNCCAHAPIVAVPSSALPAVTKAPIVTSIVLVQLASAPVFTHFRPPRT